MALGMRFFVSPLAYAEWEWFQPSLLWGVGAHPQWRNVKYKCHVPRAGPDLLSLPESGSLGHYLKVLAACIRGQFPNTICPPPPDAAHVSLAPWVCVHLSTWGTDSVTVERRAGNSEIFAFFPIKHSDLGLFCAQRLFWKPESFLNYLHFL